MTLSDACPINIINDASRSVSNGFMSIIDKSRVMLKIYDHNENRNMFIVQVPVP
jgi:hypothetical protein